MFANQSDTTRDLLHSRIRLSDGLFFRPERSGDRVWYQIEHTGEQRFFRIGLAEYTFVSLLDGDTSPAEAISLTARALGPDALTEEQAVSILTWLQDNSLATGVDRSPASGSGARDRSLKKQMERLNPFWMKIPLANPDRFVGHLTRVFRWFFSWPAACLVTFLCLTSLLIVSGKWSEFGHSSRAILAKDNWLWLTGIWLALKLIHESAHAIACRRLGAAVPETGVILILLAPLAYVDVTSSLRFRSKWQRIQIAAAGMYTEITLAALALILWSFTTAELPRHLLHSVIIMASITTIIFNANPLMRFDGYYILSDLLEIPNLYSRGNEAVKRLARRVLTGRADVVQTDTGLSGWFITAYGLAALAWRILVCVGLLIAASVLFHGLGIILTGIGILLWVLRPLLRGLRSAYRMLQLRPSEFFRASLISTAILLVSSSMLLLLPWPTSRVAPGFIEYRDLAVVRAAGPGFIRTIHVFDGQSVETDDILLEVENEELEVEVGDLLAAISQSRLRSNQSLREHDAAAAQVEVENRVSLEKRLAEKQIQLSALTVRAPASGKVMARSLRWLSDTYVHEGDELLTIGPDAQLEFHASIAEADADLLKPDDPVQIRLRGTSLFGHVRVIAPRASRIPLHDSLIAANGGPLAVRAETDDDSDGTEYELIKPRINVQCSFDQRQADSLRSGFEGTVALSSLEATRLGPMLYRTASEFVRTQLENSTRRQ
jgi:putative peptide zinc metalloprotease protein